MNFQQHYLFFKDFLIKNVSLISFISILFGVIFYYTARVLEVQNNYIIQLENSKKIYNELSQNQAVMLQKQHQIINNLETVISEKLSSINDPNALKWYALGGLVCILFVGVAAYYYSKSNNSDASAPSQPGSQSNETNAEFQTQMEKLTKDLLGVAKEEFATMSKEVIHHVDNVRTDAVYESKDHISVDIDNVKIAELVGSEVNKAVKHELSQISATIKVGIESVETASNKGCQKLYGMCSTAFEQMVHKSRNIESTNVEKVAQSFGGTIESRLIPHVNNRLKIFESGMVTIVDKYTTDLSKNTDGSINIILQRVNEALAENNSIVKVSVLQARATDRKFQDLIENFTYSRDLDSIRVRNMEASTKIMELRSSIEKSAKNAELRGEWCDLCKEISNLFS